MMSSEGVCTIIVQINDHTRINQDVGCSTIEKRTIVKEGKNAGQVNWSSIGYYGSLKQAAQQLLTKYFDLLEGPKESDNVIDLKQLIEQVNTGTDTIAKACRSRFKPHY